MFPIRKQKYNKKRFPIGIILIIFLLNLYFGEKMNIYAASIPFEGEGIAFDSEGNLWMVTHDKAAVTGIEILFAISAPTNRALRLAKKCDLTLCAFCRDNRANIYNAPERLLNL